MSSKTDTFKILEDLSLKELEETQNYITNLIANQRNLAQNLLIHPQLMQQNMRGRSGFIPSLAVNLSGWQN